MNRRIILLLVAAAVVVLFPLRSPAPAIYTPGEGWTYVPYGEGTSWQRPRAKDQLEVAQKAFNLHDYGLALRAARRVVRMWPLSDYAPHAQYLIGRSLEATDKDEMAFDAYEVVI